MTVWIEWMDRGQVRRVPVASRITVGRAPGNTVTIHDERLSREHCVIVPRAAGVAIDASRSQNGVIIGGRRSKRADIPAGGGFQLGGTVFRVVASAPAVASSVAVGPQSAHVPEPVRPSRTPAVLAGSIAISVTVLMSVVVAALLVGGEGAPGAPREPVSTSDDENAFLAGAMRANETELELGGLRNYPKNMPVSDGAQSALTLKKEDVTLAGWEVPGPCGEALQELEADFRSAGFAQVPWPNASESLYVDNRRWALLSARESPPACSVEVITGKGDRPR